MRLYLPGIESNEDESEHDELFVEREYVKTFKTKPTYF